MNFSKHFLIFEDDQILGIHAGQGLEDDYIGVIISQDMVIRNGQWVCRPEYRVSSDKNVYGMKFLMKRDPQKGQEMADLIIRNTYRTLMTRGMKGCLVYCSDEETLLSLSSDSSCTFD
jgi:DUF2075 family protein